MLIAGRYASEELVGQGAMGAVYRAVDQLSGRTVALKQLKPQVINTAPDVIERFVREGEALRQLNHPNIVKLYDVLHDAEIWYLVMEFVGGGSLRYLMSAPLPVQQVLEIGLDLADALTRAHRLQIIHRDIKPSNVLMTLDGTPRLSDFGHARFGKSSDLTQSGMIVGTLNYLSPEACQGESVDARTDIWAFGVLLFEMVSGQHPFAMDKVGATITRILTARPPDLQALCPHVPVALVDLIYRMLEKQPDDRIPTVRLVGAELEAISRGLNLSDFQSVFTTQIEKPVRPLQRRHNLPTQLTTFVGREKELVEIVELLHKPETRLLTIVGPGGMGKTRLALQTITKLLKQESGFEDGLYFVSLDRLREASAILPAIAGAIGFEAQDVEQLSKPFLAYLSGRALLLVLDNFEHLLDSVGVVTDIMRAAPSVKVLATSRERLQLQAETVFHIQGMPVPVEGAATGEIAEYDAVQLFVQQARRSWPNFEADATDLQYIVHICRLVDGMPLAILLAAAWVDMLTLEDITAEIVGSLDFLETQMRNVPERHRSIRAVFNASWRQLNTTEQRALRWLSVFRAGFTREAAQQVTDVSLQTLAALTAKSFLRRVPETGRYEIHELLRQYASEKLEASGEMETARKAHMAYFLGQTEACGLCTNEQPILNPLTEREYEVLKLIGDGLSNQDIADELFVSISTVKKHINHIYSKLNVDSRTKALVQARQLGLL